MFGKIELFLFFASLLQASRAYDDNNDDKAISTPIFYANEQYPVSASQWLYNYYYNDQPVSVFPTGFDAITVPVSQTNMPSEVFDTRQAVTPSATSYESCSSPNTEMGICATSATCTRFGGRASGSCSLGRVCCINTVSSCDQTVTLNNTYWRSPFAQISSSESTCGLTVKLDARIAEQKRPICQIRLDFLVFAISQPNSESVCTDTFDVAGANNNPQVPVICGDNDGQHMYLNVPPSDSSPTDLQLTFTFGSGGTSPRVWRMQISMLPCDAKYLAPPNCLQYFSNRSGKVISFNWRDVAGTATRQLANQYYHICFRTPSDSNAKMCFTPCAVTTTQQPFSISVARLAQSFDIPSNPGVSQGFTGDCINDFLVIPEGFNPANPVITLIQSLIRAFDRYCGERLNIIHNTDASSTICTSAAPFRITYRTNGDETATSVADTAEAGNRGFCLSYRQQ